ncbi:hypothetical protein SAMN05421760_10788 [Neptunomonas antarctica]|uniref:Uncharacterized protein n=1 Tax=Neptunomonas antarctica TaxID=619304 RepID=A0A1N7MX10_9GAMM|nr:hypothetical protein SAMN05421760_10788 [Neptunomonas antarctica]
MTLFPKTKLSAAILYESLYPSPSTLKSHKSRIACSIVSILRNTALFSWPILLPRSTSLNRAIRKIYIMSNSSSHLTPAITRLSRDGIVMQCYAMFPIASGSDGIALLNDNGTPTHRSWKIPLSQRLLMMPHAQAL